MMASKKSRVTRHGLARVLSKLGVCSRTQACELIAAGRVAVEGAVRRDAQFPVDMESTAIQVDGMTIAATRRVYLMLNKPRGIVTTAADELGRDTVYSLLKNADLPWIAPAGRLDRASEGLLLLSNDTAWTARITDPRTHLSKTYHVQVNCIPDAELLARLHAGIRDGEDYLSVKRACVLRTGEKNAWLEIVLDEGKNRHIRRLLAALQIGVLRLIRVAIGELPLGTLAKGDWRLLDSAEVGLLSGGTSPVAKSNF